MQNTSGCCHNIHTTNAPVQIFCPLFLVEVTNQYNCTVIRRCPHSKTLHQLFRPACNLKVRITPQICLYRVNDHQLWTKLYNRLSDTFIIKRQATIHFFIYKSHIPTICATCFQPWLDGIRSIIFRTLVNDLLRYPDLLTVRHCSTF